KPNTLVFTLESGVANGRDRRGVLKRSGFYEKNWTFFYQPHRHIDLRFTADFAVDLVCWSSYQIWRVQHSTLRQRYRSPGCHHGNHCPVGTEQPAYPAAE